MKKLALYTLVLLAFCNCQNKEEIKNIDSESIKDINQIVEAIIVQDSLDVFSKSEDSIMFCSQLRKLNIYIPPSNNSDHILIPRFDGIYITQLIPGIIKGVSFFSSKDSLYLLHQNSNPEKLSIEKNIINKLNSTTIEKTKIRRKNKQRSRFYEMTIPVFSEDRQSAYVELDYQCGGLCGNGQVIYLKKIKGKWNIKEKWQNWIG